ncbi:hypothetical protein LCGC14_0634390 [marine sediment metagenome]|uniref:Uncharacterized protein n=1 Tax=marine sediment metagenome TaxID=412755 RepID=A0A0F9RKG7_9ZZZZ
MDILLNPEKIMTLSGMMDVPPRYSRLIGGLVALAQYKAIVAWLEGECLDAHTGGIVKRRLCPTCWAKFVAAGKE